MTFDIDTIDLLKIGISVLCGGLLGIERQYKNKTAGFRTIILISLGSALFTMVAQHANMGVNINVITGIGFIGAGVVFKDGIGVSGLTTASVIWVAAAIGMLAGAGNFEIAIISTLVTLFVLLTFSALEFYIDKVHHHKLFVITFTDDDFDNLLKFEQSLKKHHLTSLRRQISKRDGRLQVALMVTGHRKHISEIDEMLLRMEKVQSF
jgi:putative Mg2+ transporter-C (MgtC) family protein